jgi:hypothetical protein
MSFVLRFPRPDKWPADDKVSYAVGPTLFVSTEKHVATSSCSSGIFHRKSVENLQSSKNIKTFWFVAQVVKGYLISLNLVA